jgi:hypothetical protein
MANQAFTGDPNRSWMDDLIARGPFRDAAALGCDHAGYERLWLSSGGSRRLDVYQLSGGVIRSMRAGLGLGWLAKHGPARRVRGPSASASRSWSSATPWPGSSPAR